MQNNRGMATMATASKLEILFFPLKIGEYLTSHFLGFLYDIMPYIAERPLWVAA